MPSLSLFRAACYNRLAPHGSTNLRQPFPWPPSLACQENGCHNPEFTQNEEVLGEPREPRGSGQVAQVVERSPEKAGVGGSTPSLATIESITYKPSISRFGCKPATAFFPPTIPGTTSSAAGAVASPLCATSGTSLRRRTGARFRAL